MTVFENLAFGLKTWRRPLRRFARRDGGGGEVGLASICKKARELSDGERQRWLWAGYRAGTRAFLMMNPSPIWTRLCA
jgi:hypothetical protein